MSRDENEEGMRIRLRLGMSMRIIGKWVVWFWEI